MARLHHLEAYRRELAKPPKLVPAVWGNKALRQLRKIYNSVPLPADIAVETGKLLNQISDRPWLKERGLTD